MPLGLSFDDSPETMLKKVGRPPDHRLDDRFSGSAIWHFPKYSVGIYYDSMENRLARVLLMAPGYYQSG
jgi:hypothetical protein